MPELPEVETVVCGLKKQILGYKIAGLKASYSQIIDYHLGNFKKLVIGQKVISIDRHGKYIFINLSNSKTIVAHLRMTGQLYLTGKDLKVDKHTHLEIFIKGNKKKVIYRDIRKFGRFGLIDTDKREQYIKQRKLADDALKIKLLDFETKILSKKKNIKAVLLDQTVIAGLGNIYVDEVLIREKISPLKLANKLPQQKIKKLLKTIKKVLKEAILKKGTSFSDYVTSYGEKGKFQLALKAYGQAGKPCYHCKTKIKKIKVAGRGTYYCPNCQKQT